VTVTRLPLTFPLLITVVYKTKTRFDSKKIFELPNFEFQTFSIQAFEFSIILNSSFLILKYSILEFSNGVCGCGYVGVRAARSNVPLQYTDHHTHTDTQPYPHRLTPTHIHTDTYTLNRNNFKSL
jgi:hypothetical protein